MAFLFRDFSFDAPSRLPDHHHLHHHHTESATLSVSPTSTLPMLFPARPPTPPPSSCDINDLAQALTRQHLRLVVDPNFRASNEPLTPPSDHDTFEKHMPPPPQLSLSTARMNAATLRMRRQANVRMQSSLAHVKDISSLVEKMIKVDQCNVCEPKSKPSPSPAVDDDEGVHMDYTPTAKEQIRSMLPLYRAGDRLDGSTRVSKKPRVRKSTGSISRFASKHSR
ncbi:hypothetical protein PMIN06_012593 [Paraphaeosphaeria minitans]|uniref:Uncharacterized protein n=1 Tax=Paraphaeosphaeria minitans TaxID=565426 RepID=A0A9P6G7D4_9PLEO|nr:hypothetical protein PMIN01_12784 [Paraphaeosphaeria minitans]